jgi:glutamate N-acetyltransferase/amino-acid N-acetyltransferase
MAVNLPPPAELLAVPGVRLASGAAAIKAAGRDDVVLVLLDSGTSVAGVFTQSTFRAAPVLIAEPRVQSGGVRAFLINSGNANAATGEAGIEDALSLCRAAAAALELPEASVLPFSTGVIGERLPVAAMMPVIESLPERLDENNWLVAAQAIMTTDTVAKAQSLQLDLGGRMVTITGMAKGSGMIRPDMATMLAYVCTDAAVSPDCLRQLLVRATAGSFNRITVDGDTSTNDAFILAATGQAGNSTVEDPDSAEAAWLLEGLTAVARTLAQAIVRDGEGATKFVTVSVEGGATEAECLQVAYTIAESPLVKTALFASDPNWGRLAMAIGRAGIENLDPAGVQVFFGDVQVMRDGLMDPGYSEEAGAAVLAAAEFTIRVGLGRGDAMADVWTSDLSYEYVRINAEYRT